MVMEVCARREEQDAVDQRVFQRSCFLFLLPRALALALALVLPSAFAFFLLFFFPLPLEAREGLGEGPLQGVDARRARM